MSIVWKTIPKGEFLLQTRKIRLPLRPSKVRVRYLREQLQKEATLDQSQGFAPRLNFKYILLLFGKIILCISGSVQLLYQGKSSSKYL